MANHSHYDLPDIVRTSLFRGTLVKRVYSTIDDIALLLDDGTVFLKKVKDIDNDDRYEKLAFRTDSGAGPPFIIDICGGAGHFLALSEEGRVYGWGDNKKGQLGVSKKQRKIPAGDPAEGEHNRVRRIGALLNYDVISIASGESHCLALTRDGRLFSWGANDSGQLGIDTKVGTSNPTEVQSLKGVPLLKIAAGGAHSVAISVTGAVFTWGDNRHGQLGFNRERNDCVPCPTAYTFMSESRVQQVSCGDSHTSFMMKNGRVYVLGLGVKKLPCQNNPLELLPGQTDQFHFANMTSVRSSTFLYDDMTCTLYVLHHANAPSEGAIENAGTLLIPETIKASSYKLSGDDGFPGCLSFYDNCNMKAETSGHDDTFTSDPHSGRSKIHTLLFSGHKHLFVLDLDTDVVKTGTKSSRGVMRGIATLSKDLLEGVTTGEPSTKESCLNELKLVLSSPACINASFLHPHPHNIDGPVIDFEAAAAAFQILKGCDKFLKISNIIKATLRESVPGGASLKQSLRFYLTLMECPVFHKPHEEDSRKALVEYARAILIFVNREQVESSISMLAGWWKSEPKSFKRLICAYRVAVSYIIKEKERISRMADELKTFLSILDFLHRVNVEKDILSVSVFYVPGLDKQNPAIDWELEIGNRFTLSRSTFNWLDHPYLINLQMKACIITRHDMIEEYNGQLFSLYPLELTVDRRDVLGPNLEEQLEHFLGFSMCDLHQPLQVTFIGEAGIDAGALSKEFFRLAFSVLFDRDKLTNCGEWNLFRFIDENDTQSHVWFRECSCPARVPRQVCRHATLAQICGLMFGLALHNKALVELPFPQLLYAKLLHQEPESEIEQLAELDKNYADQMKNLLALSDEDIAACCYGATVVMDDGTRADVSKENVQRYVNQIVHSAMAPYLFTEFRIGFYKVYSKEVLRLFRPNEFQAYVVGEKYFDWRELEKCMKEEHYQLPFSPTHPTITMFWQAIHELSDDMKRKFLVFVSGSDRVPIGGLKNFKLLIKPLPIMPEEGVDDVTLLSRTCPEVHACDRFGYQRTLDLPMYDSLDVIRDRLSMTLSMHLDGFHKA